MIDMTADPKWIIEMAERENGCIVSVGGLVLKLAKIDFDPPTPPAQPEEPRPITPAATHTP